MKRQLVYFFGLLLIGGMVFTVKYPLLFKSKKVMGVVADLQATHSQISNVTNLLAEQQQVDYFPLIRFAVSGNDYHIKGPENMYLRGDSVRVCYLPGKEVKARVDSFQGIWVDGFLMIPLILFLVWSAFVFSFIKKK